MNSKRIETLSSMIPSNAKGVFDVGSDHGYLLISLRNKNKNLKLCGVENKEGPYKNLLNNIVNKNIIGKLSDGLNDYSNDYDTVVLAGMGFNNICSIINSNLNKINDIEYFLIDSHNLIPSIRLFFNNLGYYIENENIVYENNIYYELILFKKGHQNYSDKELKYGPILLNKKDSVLIDKYKKINDKILKLINENKLDKNSYEKYKKEYEENLMIINELSI